jgi:hypothetical protein
MNERRIKASGDLNPKRELLIIQIIMDEDFFLTKKNIKHDA